MPDTHWECLDCGWPWPLTEAAEAIRLLQAELKGEKANA